MLSLSLSPIMLLFFSWICSWCSQTPVSARKGGPTTPPLGVPQHQFSLKTGALRPLFLGARPLFPEPKQGSRNTSFGTRYCGASSCFAVRGFMGFCPAVQLSPCPIRSFDAPSSARSPPSRYVQCLCLETSP